MSSHEAEAAAEHDSKVKKEQSPNKNKKNGPGKKITPPARGRKRAAPRVQNVGISYSGIGN